MLLITNKIKTIFAFMLFFGLKTFSYSQNLQPVLLNDENNLPENISLDTLTDILFLNDLYEMSMLEDSISVSEFLGLLPKNNSDLPLSIGQFLPTLLPLKITASASLKVSSSFGFRIHPVSKKYRFHAGIDFPAPNGTVVIAGGAGVVLKKGYDATGLGNFIEIDHLNGFVSCYGHLLLGSVAEGDFVNQGEFIGFVGSSGLSTGNHLHYTVKRNGTYINPLRVLFPVWEKLK